MISVIVPVHRRDSKLSIIREVVSSSSTPFELIIVINNKDLEGTIRPDSPRERVVTCIRRGRGYTFIRGVLESKGDIILLLHSDTMLPFGWDKAITKVLEDDQIVGGGFSMSFDIPSFYLNALIRLSDLRFHLTGEILGDRAIFVRSEVIRQCLPAMDLPIFEDVQLSKFMRERGKVILLKEKVITSADAFRTNGMIGHILRIVKCRLLYAFGRNPQRIYECYYTPT